MQFGGELVGVAHHDDAAGRIVTEQPCHIGDRDADRFQGARRLVDEEPGDVARLHTHQLVDDGVDMPVRQVGCARQYGLEALPDEEAQVAPQQRGKSGLLVHLGAFLFERAPGFEAGSSAGLPVERSLRRPRIRPHRQRGWLGHRRAAVGPVRSVVVVEAHRQLKEAIERARIALERLLAQHHQGSFLRRSRSRAAALLHLDRRRQRALHVGLEIAHAFAATGRVARLARSELAVRRGLAIPDLVALLAVAGRRRGFTPGH